MSRILRALGYIALIFGSLICFPAYLSWMVGVWIALALMANYRSKPMWPRLVGCILILLIKRPGFTIEFFLLCGLFVGVSGWDWRRRSGTESPAFDAKALSVVAIVLMAGTVGYGTMRWLETSVSRQRVLNDRPIACLGDSLTDYGYPDLLEELVAVPVEDFGVNGINTDDGIKMIPEILATNPQLVVIELGGHDYNGDKKSRSATNANLDLLIYSFLKEDIGVVLVEIPRGFVSDPYDGLERELCAKHDLQMVDDSLIRSFVFNSPILPPGIWLDPAKRYSDDGLHPNKLGNQRFAEAVAKSLVAVFGENVLRE